MKAVRMKLVAAAATLALAGSMTGLTSAAAAPAAPVKNSHLPALSAVAKAVPAVKKGQRLTIKEKRIGVPGKGCNNSSMVKAASGRVAIYSPAFDPETMPESELGFTDFVTVHVVRFGTVKQATTRFRAYERHAAKCSGKKLSDGSVGTKFSLPKVGQQRVGMRLKGEIEGMTLHMNQTVVRNGSTLILSLVSGSASVKKKTSVALARVSLKQAR